MCCNCAINFLCFFLKQVLLRDVSILVMELINKSNDEFGGKALPHISFCGYFALALKNRN